MTWTLGKKITGRQIPWTNEETPVLETEVGPFEHGEVELVGEETLLVVVEQTGNSNICWDGCNHPQEMEIEIPLAKLKELLEASGFTIERHVTVEFSSEAK